MALFYLLPAFNFAQDEKTGGDGIKAPPALNIDSSIVYLFLLGVALGLFFIAKDKVK